MKPAVLNDTMSVTQSDAQSGDDVKHPQHGIVEVDAEIPHEKTVTVATVNSNNSAHPSTLTSSGRVKCAMSVEQRLKFMGYECNDKYASYLVEYSGDMILLVKNLQLIIFIAPVKRSVNYLQRVA